MGGKTEGKRGMEGAEWRGGEADGEAAAELVADPGESHTLMNGEQGGLSSSSGSSLQSSMAGIASSMILTHPAAQPSHSQLSQPSPSPGQRQTRSILFCRAQLSVKLPPPLKLAPAAALVGKRPMGLEGRY